MVEDVVAVSAMMSTLKARLRSVTKPSTMVMRIVSRPVVR